MTFSLMLSSFNLGQPNESQKKGLKLIPSSVSCNNGVFRLCLSIFITLDPFYKESNVFGVHLN